MRKVTALMCAICMLFLVTGALAAPGDAYLFTDDQKKALDIENYYSPSAASIGDTMYTLWGNSICAWTVGDEAPVKVASNIPSGNYSTYEDAQEALGDDASKVINEIVGDGTVIYGLNKNSGLLYPLTFADGKVVYGDPVKLEWSDITDMMNGDTYFDLTGYAISGGVLYVTIRTDNNYDNPTIASFDLATGERDTVNAEYVSNLTAYRDGKLLMEIYDMSNAYHEDTGEMDKPTLAIYDPADGSVTEAGTFGDVNVFGLAYNPDNDTLYYTTISRLMAMAGLGEAEQVAYMPVDYADSAVACMLPGGLYALYTWNGLIVRNTDPQYMPQSTLSIYGGYLDDTARAFTVQYPDIPLTFNENVYFDTASALAQAMASGDNAFDLYNIYLSYQDFAGLMQKGYCLNLSDYPAVANQLSGLYPFLQKAIMLDGNYYAVPTNLYSYGISIFPDVWEEAGLTDRIPTSFMGLIDFLQWWVDEGMDEYPDVQLFEYAYDYSSMLFQTAMDLYIAKTQAEGEELSLNTPLFREMMSAIEELDTDALNDTIPDSDDDDGMYIDYSENSLFTNSGEWLSVDSGYSYGTPLVLPIEEGGPAYVPAYISCLFVNPNSENLDMAIAYLQCEMDNMEPQQHVMMFPDDNEPVPNDYYVDLVTDYEEMLADAQAQLETADPADVKDIQSNIDSYQDFLDHKDDYYWLISAESITEYRKYAAMCYASTPNVLNYSDNGEGTSEIYTLMQRYQQKQITLDQFLTQADQKIRMIQLERQ